MTRPPSRAVTFDLWHTLVYLGPRAEERYMKRQTDLAVEVLETSDRTSKIPSVGPTPPRQAFELQRAAAIAGAARGRVVTVCEQFVRAARDAGRVARPDLYLNELRAEVQRTRFRRAPGGLSTLRALRKEGFRIGVISNTVGEPGEFLRPMLRDMGFDPYVEAYMFSDEQSTAKPAPGIFRVALRALGTTPAHAVHVGDAWSDLEGARRAGLRAGVWFTGLREYGPSYRALFGTPPGGVGRPRYQVDRLDEVPALVRRLLPA